LSRIGVFGGTFDPVHMGHLVLAEQGREQGPLDRVLFIPAARPPHKLDRVLTPFPQRVEMLALAIAGHSAFQIDELEKDRPGPSYTVDTLEELHRRFPNDQFTLLIGSDCLPDLVHWRDPAGIATFAEVLVLAHLHFPDNLALRVAVAPLVDISSRDLRRRAAEGRSLRYLVPRAVECYIQNHHLYADA